MPFLQSPDPAPVAPMRRLLRHALPMLALGGLLLTTACATRPPASDPDALAEYKQTNDPLEPFNRKMFAVNNTIDKYTLRPAAVGYVAVVPNPVREGIHNVLSNLKTPWTLANDMMQGQPRRAGDTLGRFVVNTTVGLGGIFDVGNAMGVRAHSADFGQTLGHWGVGEGPFLFLPILGPSNPRDLTGTAIELVGDPLNWFGQGTIVDALLWTRAGLTVLDTRAGLIQPMDDVMQNSLDPYATIRSAYRQQRRAEIEALDHPDDDDFVPVPATATPEEPKAKP